MQTEAERAAYMAAAIDGEGSILLIRQAADDTTKSPRFRAAVQVTNTQKPWLETLQSWYGGAIYRLAISGKTKRPCYVLKHYGDDAKRLLSAVMPYLLIKRRRAELLLEFYEVAAERAKTSRAAQSVDPKILAAQQRLWVDIGELNRRGVGPLNLRGGEPVKRLCSVEDCGRKHYGHGYCWKHYRKYIVRGGTAIYEKKCEQCGREFVARRSDAKYCSSDCGDKKLYSDNRQARLLYAKEYRARKKDKSSQVCPVSAL